MFLLLSSGARPEYLRDVCRALALPTGALFQFRYDLKWVSPSVREALDAKRIGRESEILLCYVDQSAGDADLVVIPLRLARIQETLLHGSSCSVLFEVGDIVCATNLKAMNQTIRMDPAAAVVRRKDIGQLEGFYWCQLTSDPLTWQVGTERVLEQSSDLESRLNIWEQVVRQLAPRSDFQSIRLFYHIVRLRRVEGSVDVTAVAGAFPIKSKANYEIQIFHYHPTQEANHTLVFQAASNWLALQTNPELTIQTRYAWRFVRFRTDAPPLTISLTKGVSRQTTAVISVFSRPLAGQEERHGRNASVFGTWEFDFQFRIATDVLTNAILGLVLGLLLSAPQLVVIATTKPPLRFGTAGIVVLLNILVGVLMSFGVRKPG